MVALIAAHLNAEMILVTMWQQRGPLTAVGFLSWGTFDSCGFSQLGDL